MRTRSWILPAACAVVLIAALWLVASIVSGTTSRPGSLATPESGREARAGGEQPLQDAEPTRTPVADLPVAPAPDGVVVRGRVVDAYGEPVGDALVGEITSARPVRTASDGRFQLGVERPDRAGPLTLLILAAGHPPLVSEHDLEGGTSFDAGDVQLLNGGRVRGQVVDGAANPYPGASVRLQLLSRGAWPASLDPNDLVAPATTGADGAYSFAALVPGTYWILATAPGMQVVRSGPVIVRDGAETAVDPIALAVGHPLTGRVLGPGDVPVAGASVWVRSGRGQPYFRGQTESDADGRFEMGALPPGAMRVEVTKAGFLRFERADVDASRDEELVVRLESGLRITGTVVDAVTRRPVERFAVAVHRIGELDPTSNGTMVQQLEREIEALRETVVSVTDPAQRDRQLAVQRELESRLERIRREASSRPVVVPADVGPEKEWPDGRFSCGGYEEGLYSVGIEAPAHRFTAIEPVELRRGTEPPDLRFELEAGLGLTGVVVARPGGAPVADAVVDLVRVDDEPRDVTDASASPFAWAFAPGPAGVTVMTTRSGADGRFGFEQAAPGRYLLSVDGTHIAHHDTGAFELRGRAREIRIEVGARASLTGRVGGVPPGREGAVEVLVLGGHGTLRRVKIGADGTYRFDGLQPGGYIVRAFQSDASRYVDRLIHTIFPEQRSAVDPERIPPRDVTLAEGEHRVFDLTVDRPPAGLVRGTASINGRAATGARAILRPVPGDAPGAGGLSLRATCDEMGRFEVRDVPAGDYTFELYAASWQQIHDESITVTADRATVVAVDVAAGGLRGHVFAPDVTDPNRILGYVWLLPGADEEPPDLYAYRRTARTHRIRVRGGAFEATGLTPGPALVVVDIRGRERVVTKTAVPAGDTRTLDLTAGARLPGSLRNR